MKYFLDNIQEIRHLAYDGRMIIRDYFKKGKKFLYEEFKMKNGDILVYIFENDKEGRSFLDDFCEARKLGGWVDGFFKKRYIDCEIVGDLSNVFFNNALAVFKYNIFNREVDFINIQKNCNMRFAYEFFSLEEYENYSIQKQIDQYNEIKSSISDRLKEGIKHLNSIKFTKD